MSRAEDIFQKLIYFGEDALDDFIINRQAEELFLDFKQTTPGIGKNVTSLPRDDRKNLAKCISGFGNSEGGVIVWGVECSRDMDIGDVAKAKIKVPNVHRYLSWLENAISGCTIPSHNKVRNHIISSDENGNGYIATYIPKAEAAPLMSTVGNNIYIRSGSNNVPAPYSVIAGMFGRSPQPNVELILTDRKLEILDNKTEQLIHPDNETAAPKAAPEIEKIIKISFAVHLQNDSSVIARELYLSCSTGSGGGEYNKVRFLNYNQMDSIAGMPNQLNLISRPELRLPPRGTLKFANIEMIFTSFVDSDFLFDGVVGADEAAPKSFRFYINKNTLRSYVAKALRQEEGDEEENRLLVNEFFNDFFRSEF